MGLDGTRGSGRSGRDHNYYLYQTKLPGLPSAAQPSLSRKVRERMITGLVMSLLSPLIMHSLE